MKAPSTFTVAIEWSADTARRLTTFVTEVARALNGRLTFEENFRAEWREITFVGGATDLDVRTPLVQPRGVHLAEVRNLDTGAPIGAVVSLDWQRIEGGFRIRAINGLTSGTRYLVRLLVVEA